jgi:peptidyl-prolyl cis-trans isomerase A (cyclophilin A)
MANRGANTNSAQFFITDAAAAHLDGGYTIFGQCGVDVVHVIANVKTGPADRPTQPITIKTIKIVRK